MRILIVTSRFPYPPWRGNQVRTVEWLEALGNHQLHLISPVPRGTGDDPRLAKLEVSLRRYSVEPVRRVVSLLGSLSSGHPVQEALYATASGRREVARTLMGWQPDLVVVQMVRCGWAADVVRSVAGATPVLFDAIDAMGLHFERAAEAANGPARAIYRWEAARCRAREAEIVGRAALTTAVSTRDVQALEAERALVVPVAAREMSVGEAGDRAPVVLLSGNLGYRPTVDGARWFAKEVWPGVRRQVPGATWTLAGARPARAVRRLNKLDGVRIQENVPDLAPIFGSAAVAIAPMSSGSGVPMKVLEAWAAGLPVVGHPWMAGGVEAEARDAMVVAESPDDWQMAVVKLLTDREEAGRLATRGREAWRNWYHRDRVSGLIRQAVLLAVDAEDSQMR